MTRKDYILIAAAIKSARRDNIAGRPRQDLSDHNRGVDWAARSVADELARDNAAFDRARFLAACGVTA